MAHHCKNCGRYFKSGPALGGHKKYCNEIFNHTNVPDEREPIIEPIPCEDSSQEIPTEFASHLLNALHDKPPIYTVYCDGNYYLLNEVYKEKFDLNLFFVGDFALDLYKSKWWKVKNIQGNIITWEEYDTDQ